MSLTMTSECFGGALSSQWATTEAPTPTRSNRDQGQPLLTFLSKHTDRTPSHSSIDQNKTKRNVHNNNSCSYHHHEVLSPAAGIALARHGRVARPMELRLRIGVVRDRAPGLARLGRHPSALGLSTTVSCFVRLSKVDKRSKNQANYMCELGVEVLISRLKRQRTWGKGEGPDKTGLVNASKPIFVVVACVRAAVRESEVFYLCVFYA